MGASASGSEELRRWPVVTGSGWRRFAPVWRASVWSLVQYGSVLIPFVLLLLILWLIWYRTPRVPWWDEWSQVLPLLQAADAGTLNVTDLWESVPVSGHRIVIPRLIVLGFIELTGWNRQVQMTVSVVIGVLTMLLLLASVRRTFGSRRSVIALSGPFALLVLSQTQYENWLWPMGIGFIFTLFSAALCLWALITRSRRTAFLVATAGALAGSLATAAGLVLWIAFLPAIRRLGKREVTLWVAAAIGVFIAYGNQFGSDPNLAGQLPSGYGVDRILKYVLAILGAPAGYGNINRSIALALFSGAVALASVFVLHRLRVAQMVISSWLGLAAFAMGCVVLVGLGRIDVQPPEMYVPSRYGAYAAAWWVAVIALVSLSTVQLVRARRKAGNDFADWFGQVLIAANIVTLAVLVVALLAANWRGFRHGSVWMDFPTQQQSCVLAPEFASEFCLSIFNPNRSLARSQLLYTAERRLGVFRDRPAIDVGQLQRLDKSALGAIDVVNRQPVTLPPAENAPTSAATPVAGDGNGANSVPQDSRPARERNRDVTRAVVTVSAGQPVLVGGWAVDTASNGPAGGVIVTIDKSTLVLANPGQERPALAEVYHEPAYAATGFAAFIPPEALPVGRHVLRLMVLTPDGTAHASVPQAVELRVEESESIDPTELAPQEESATGIIEQVNGRYLPDQQLWPFVEPADKPLAIEGWVIDPAAGLSARAAFMRVDDRLMVPAQVGLPRGDVAMALHHPEGANGIDYALLGFRGVIPGGTLAPGRHTVELLVVSQDGRSYYEASSRLITQIDVE